MSAEGGLSFWDHLDVLRDVLIRCIIAWAVGMLVCFCFKDALFYVLFAPSKSDFILYRGINYLAHLTGWSGLELADFHVRFINTELAAQFLTHIQVAVWAGLVLAFPYIVYQLYGFVAPALYEQEKRYSARLIAAATALFLCGVALNYFIIFPFAFRFLSGYQVQEQVVNQIALSSYIQTLLLLTLLLGVMFELPIIAYFLAKMGLIEADTLRHYRRHALVVITVIAAVITPTADAVTLMLVTLPIYGLYEISILVIKRIEKTKQ